MINTYFNGKATGFKAVNIFLSPSSFLDNFASDWGRRGAGGTQMVQHLQIRKIFLGIHILKVN